MRLAFGAAACIVVLASSAALSDDSTRPLAERIREATQKATRGIATAGVPSKGDATKNDARTLAALALVRAGGAPERKLARELLDGWWNDQVAASGRPHFIRSANYELALFIMALDGLSLERVEEPGKTTREAPRFKAHALPAADRARLEMATQTLLASAVKTCDGKGLAWGYGAATLREPGTEEPAHAFKPTFAQWDASNTQFSILALHDAARAGIAIPREVGPALVRHLLATALENDTMLVLRRKTHEKKESTELVVGWGYAPKVASDCMTFAGLSSLAIARELGGKDPALERTMKGALAIIPSLVPDTTRELPANLRRSGWGPSYNLYSLEKALDLLEVAELEGKPWFPPLADHVLALQGKNGLWNDDVVDTCLHVIFLARGTLAKSRIVATGAGARSPGDVLLARTKKNVNVLEVLAAYDKDPKTRAAADEAVHALALEGHGEDACLLEPLAGLAARKDRAEAASRWLTEISGVPLDATQARAEADAYGALDGGEAKALRGALVERALPVRAYAARELAALQDRSAASDIVSACAALSKDTTLLATAAGARCARAFGDSLTGLLCAGLPELPQGSVTPAQLKKLADAASAKIAAGK